MYVVYIETCKQNVEPDILKDFFPAKVIYDLLSDNLSILLVKIWAFGNVLAVCAYRNFLFSLR